MDCGVLLRRKIVKLRLSQNSESNIKENISVSNYRSFGYLRSQNQHISSIKTLINTKKFNSQKAYEQK